jgi:hypothetical protein
MIPQEKSAAVTRGLREAFGVTEFEEIHQITKGHTSSLVFRIVVGGSPYLLKIILRTDDPTRHYTCMKAAAEAGLAPRVWYTNVPDRISITNFVGAAPFPAADALVRMPATLRRLHALAPFPRVPDAINTSCMCLIQRGPGVDGLIQGFQAASILCKRESEELFARYAQVIEAYRSLEPDMVPSHNDLFKPDNVLFDGRQVWLVDWEAAFLNDRYADLAVVANQLVANEAEERTYLQEYFGVSPDPYQLARFFLMQQLAHIFYAMVFLLLGSTGSGKPVDWSEAVPAFSEFHRRMWAGEVDLTDNHTKVVYGRVHSERLLHNVGQARYEDALRIVSERRVMA